MKRLNKMPYAKAITYTEQDGTVVLVSYNTRVACVTPDGEPHCSMLYSATTRKHISAFADEFGMSYKDFKHAYETEDLNDLPPMLDTRVAGTAHGLVWG